jgi:DNA modification methylase
MAAEALPSWWPTVPGDLVLDPAAGGYGVLDAAVAMGRHFVGCDLAATSEPNK